MDPGYTSSVPNPMDLSTVLAKGKASDYQNPHQIRVDVNQIWHNCVTYNGATDDAVLMAREVSKAFEMLYADRVFYPVSAPEQAPRKKRRHDTVSSVACFAPLSCIPTSRKPHKRLTVFSRSGAGSVSQHRQLKLWADRRASVPV